MTTKHNNSHPGRGRSHYRDRLAKRGLSKSPRLPDLEDLQRTQERREEATGFPWWTGTESPAEETNPGAERLLKAVFSAEKAGH